MPNRDMSTVRACFLDCHVKKLVEAAQKLAKFSVIFFLIWNIKCQQSPAYTILVQFMAQYFILYHQLPWELPEQWFFIMCGTFHTMKVSPNTLQSYIKQSQ